MAAELQPCAGGVIFDADHRLLLVQRGQQPDQGAWSIPGGRCLAAESPAEACVREVAEETGLRVRAVQWVGRVERPGAGSIRYAIDDFLCEVLDGTLRAGDDAADAGWFSRSDLEALR